MTKTVVLCILDGWGHQEGGATNAIAHAQTPHWDALKENSPHTLLEASELNVGLPEGQMGNSEVGHMNIGAGRVILQDLPRIDEAISKSTLEQSPFLQDFIKSLQQAGGTCHLLGLLSSGGIHSHQRHIEALAKILITYQVPVAVHAFLDGRDTPPKSAAEFLTEFLAFIEKNPGVSLATVGGRYYGMDRDNRWDRIHKAYEAMANGMPSTDDALAYIDKCYQEGITDEFIPPLALTPYKGMHDGDGLLMANFRSDRARQILTSFLEPDFQEFERSRTFSFSAALGTVEYSNKLNQHMETLFPPVTPEDVLGEVIARHGLKQLRMAETEKYAHVTFFFNGGREDAFPGEDRILVPSPKVATYDLKPEMSAFELTDQLVKAIQSRKYTLIVVNFANTDMVGHTGNFEAARKAVEAVDICLGKIREAVEKADAALVITADHGNAEVMYDNLLESTHTAHTLNPVPFLVFNVAGIKLHPGKLSDVSPTILQILDLSKPVAMTGVSLIEKSHG